MERRSQKLSNNLPRPQVFLKRPKLKGKSIEEIKAILRVTAEIQKAASNG